jgi:flagellar motility protein MotE (MotC chaperone)
MRDGIIPHRFVLLSTVDTLFSFWKMELRPVKIFLNPVQLSKYALPGICTELFSGRLVVLIHFCWFYCMRLISQSIMPTPVHQLHLCGSIMKQKLSFFFLFLLSVTTILTPVSLLAAEEPKETKRSEKSEVPPTTPPQEKSYSSVEERRLYDTLEQERAGLQEKIKVLADREKELKTLEQEVDKKFEQMEKKIQELKKLQQKTEELLAQKDAAELKKIEELSKIYSKMEPDKAALALSVLKDQQLAADIIAGMKTKSAAKVMEQLDKLKASSLTTTLSTLSTE